MVNKTGNDLGAMTRKQLSIDARVVDDLDLFRKTDKWGDRESWTVFFKRILDTGKLEK